MRCICADPDLPEAPVMDIGVPQMIRDGMLQIYLDSAYVLHPFSWPTPEHIAVFDGYGYVISYVFLNLYRLISINLR